MDFTGVCVFLYMRSGSYVKHENDDDDGLQDRLTRAPWAKAEITRRHIVNQVFITAESVCHRQWYGSICLS